ncbi:hypothetical protein AWB82_06186 [Caballeronia glebae]|uniref:Uncharacterized protein n=1 Tax=Caballeronia glebae TaxID=1777143 RepID=A0A158D2V8_9BURK|nr:hypothetical protein [Caballeronia glebae]SAK88690.1 hypothetical protein AWB82_06186 [Caballeronia glebae]
MYDEASGPSTIKTALKDCQKQIDHQLDLLTLQSSAGLAVPVSRNLLFLLYRSFTALEHAQQAFGRADGTARIRSADSFASDLEERALRWRRVGLPPPLGK